jgi:hypothetical protein
LPSQGGDTGSNPVGTTRKSQVKDFQAIPWGHPRRNDHTFGRTSYLARSASTRDDERSPRRRQSAGSPSQPARRIGWGLNEKVARESFRIGTPRGWGAALGSHRYPLGEVMPSLEENVLSLIHSLVAEIGSEEDLSFASDSRIGGGGSSAKTPTSTSSLGGNEDVARG